MRITEPGDSANVAKIRATQGLPAKIEDAETVAKLASIFGRAFERRQSSECHRLLFDESTASQKAAA